ncbi:GH19779 [Drosophila grimshawi]|uniref:GH19779 n=1 Tax=Drosophila grimshawi TaxID=7222 RepID=B4J424_DROGR|nr:GH19779 [Drosophila grimshawi]
MGQEYEIRSANMKDIGLIESLFLSESAIYFGEKQEPPLTQLFHEYQTHRLVAYQPDNPNELQAYCEFCIYPNIPVLSNDYWIQWLQTRFCIDLPISLMNTIFFNFYIQIKNHDEILNLVIMELFYREHKVTFLIVVRPPNYSSEEYEMLQEHGKIYYPIAFNMFSCRNLPTINIIKRSEFMPEITFRKALPEDNDDVIEMIDFEEPEMRQVHGDYFIAEVLMGAVVGNLDKDKIIVTEDPEAANGGTTGMMWLTEEVNIEMLIKNFDLESLGNLVTCTPDAPHGVIQFNVFTAEQRHYFNLNTEVNIFKRSSARLDKTKIHNAHHQNYIFTKFKYITDELKNRNNYLHKVTKTLSITFDLLARKSLIRNQKYCLNNSSNAFMMKNFILHPSLRLEHTYYYLCAMFSAYPDKDYCVIAIPANTKYSASLWALLKFFIRVKHRPSCEISDEIFIAHRCSVSTELCVFPLMKDDIDDVAKMAGESNCYRSSAETIGSQCPILMQIISDYLYNQKSEFKCWVIRCGTVGRENTIIVGFVTLRPFSNYEAVYKQYMLPHNADYLTYDRGEIIMLRLHPYFHMWSDEILRTVAIRSSFRELFYFEVIGDVEMSNDLSRKMMPIEPRRKIRNWFTDTESPLCYRRSSMPVKIPLINCVKDNYYLFRHNLFPTKYFGNQNPLVVVGFSDICKAFLRLIVFGWNTTDYKNVSVNNCLPLVDITVIVNYGEIEAEYDPNVTCLYCTSNNECYLNSAHSCPFVMDTTKRLDMRNWINFVAGNVESIDRGEKCIVLDNNCKIHYDKLLLLCDTKFGLSTLDSDPISDSQTPYNYAHINGRLDKIILYHKLIELSQGELSRKHIVIYGYALALYECIDFLLRHNCYAHDIVYVQPHIVQEPEYLNNPTIDKNLDTILLQMLSDLGIRNRQILVDEQYCTNDPHIYAAGKHVTFIWEVLYQYTNVSEYELAHKLIDILELGQKPITTERKFSKPCLFHAQLPLEHMIIKITMPKRYLMGKLSNEYSYIMTTYSGDFCRIRMNLKWIVEEIVCVSRQLNKPPYFLEHFCGKHEALLNNMRGRWKMGLIPDFVSFFEQPWTEYIMHDRFNDMQVKNHATIISLMNMHCGVQGMNIGDSDFADARKHFLEANLLKFLRKFRKEFVNEFPLPEDWESEQYT